MTGADGLWLTIHGPCFGTQDTTKAGTKIEEKTTVCATAPMPGSLSGKAIIR